jgi:hypothetical protein
MPQRWQLGLRKRPTSASLPPPPWPNPLHASAAAAASPAGIFPLSAAGFEHLQGAVERLTLNDASGERLPASCGRVPAACRLLFPPALRVWLGLS